MKARYSLGRLTLVLLLLALLAGVASCTKKAAAGPRAWIDSPREGASLPPGTPVPVVCRATAPKGVAEVFLSVNGAPYRSVPVADAATSCAVTMDWLPAEPGMYTLQVTAQDTAGTASGPDTVIVKIEGATSGQPTETLATVAVEETPAEATATPTATVEEPTPTPTNKPSATLTLTATPIPPAEVAFSAEQETIHAGECTILHWSVEHATGVYLNGAGVVGSDSKEVCPAVTTTYALHVQAPGGNVDVNVTVTVLPDETAPAVPKLKSPEDGQSVTPLTCPAKITLAWSPVTDPSGVTYEVIVFWKDGVTWRKLDDWGSLTKTSFNVILDCSKEYRWSVRARDGAGNWSAWADAFVFKLGSH